MSAKQMLKLRRIFLIKVIRIKRNSEIKRNWNKEKTGIKRIVMLAFLQNSVYDLQFKYPQIVCMRIVDQ